ncbi:hypothetical protein ACFT4A_02590 [Streptomyces sp. NPDC057099]|uniref:hypothetical protein n=1 Tax=Streptomyces sp. NPDC057099 TaxID=3346019 RepID=UPI003630C1DE
MEALERDCRFKVYYAGERRPTKASFERPDVGAHRDSASVYYHQSDIRLPFMLRQAARYSPDFPRCKEYEYQQIGDIVRDIEESGTSHFD